MQKECHSTAEEHNDVQPFEEVQIAEMIGAISISLQ